MLEPSDRYFLVAVLELDPKTHGLALEALHRQRVVALAMPSVGEIRVLFDHARPRIIVLDVSAPDEEELALVRALRASESGESLSIVLLGNVPEQTLPVEICELVDIYIPKPTDWTRVARSVISLANGRRPPSTGVFPLRHA